MQGKLPCMVPSNRAEGTEELSIVPDERVKVDDVMEGAYEEVEEAER